MGEPGLRRPSGAGCSLLRISWRPKCGEFFGQRRQPCISAFARFLIDSPLRYPKDTQEILQNFISLCFGNICQAAVQTKLGLLRAKSENFWILEADRSKPRSLETKNFDRFQNLTRMSIFGNFNRGECIDYCMLYAIDGCFG